MSNARVISPSGMEAENIASENKKEMQFKLDQVFPKANYKTDKERKAWDELNKLLEDLTPSYLNYGKTVSEEAGEVIRCRNTIYCSRN